MMKCMSNKAGHMRHINLELSLGKCRMDIYYNSLMCLKKQMDFLLLDRTLYTSLDQHCIPDTGFCKVNIGSQHFHKSQKDTD